MRHARYPRHDNAGQQYDGQRTAQLFAAATLFPALPPFLAPSSKPWLAEQR